MQPNTDFSKNSKHLGAYSQTSQDVGRIEEKETHVERNLTIATTLALSPIHPPLNPDAHDWSIGSSGGIPANHVKERKPRKPKEEVEEKIEQEG